MSETCQTRASGNVGKKSSSTLFGVGWGYMIPKAYVRHLQLHHSQRQPRASRSPDSRAILAHTIGPDMLLSYSLFTCLSAYPSYGLPASPHTSRIQAPPVSSDELGTRHMERKKGKQRREICISR